ncbi:MULTISPECIES: nitroreductase family protein [unclassified Halomonas]|uniref:nitroreductase family protein n=1 Tax=unclassified Halomonas TaxID=2609666 RepID=UPI0021E4A1D2|nr:MULTISPECIES: nitroreductase family protein [unclassified Halomonas]UYG00705.1 nitroreductase family protein [Halomonas sp. GD1P12]WNL41539.1 nitroreductase family protein [Halomonas sp. PAMB 3264]
MTNPAIDVFENRRSQYAIGKEIPLSQDETSELIQKAVKLAPSSFNSQSSRAVILFDEAHGRFWQIVMDTLREMVPPESFDSTEKKVNGFAAGAGTVLFFEEQDVIKNLQEKFPLYADNFPVWSEHSTGIAQFAVWTALAEANIGASLQHYNPIIDEAVAKEWNLPPTWKLRAQMPFGSHEGEFGEKTFMDDNERFRVFA